MQFSPIQTFFWMCGQMTTTKNLVESTQSLSWLECVILGKIREFASRSKGTTGTTVYLRTPFLRGLLNPALIWQTYHFLESPSTKTASGSHLLKQICWDPKIFQSSCDYTFYLDHHQSSAGAVESGMHQHSLRYMALVFFSLRRIAFVPMKTFVCMWLILNGKFDRLKFLRVQNCLRICATVG